MPAYLCAAVRLPSTLVDSLVRHVRRPAMLLAAASLTFTLDSGKDVVPSFVVAGGAPVIGIVKLNAVSFTVGVTSDISPHFI